MQEDGPRWSDSLTNKSGGYRWYQLTDSIFWRWEGNNILLWKIGETAHEMKISRKNEECSQSSKIERMHQWLDGTFIALGGNLSAGNDSCQYAVLDTTSGTLTYKRLDKNLEWIRVCDDVRAWKGDVYCLLLDEKDGKLPGSLLYDRALHFDHGIADRLGNVYFRQYFRRCLSDFYHAFHVHSRTYPCRGTVY